MRRAGVGGEGGGEGGARVGRGRGEGGAAVSLALIRRFGGADVCTRVRINCVGIADVINFDGGKNVAQYQVRGRAPTI